MYLHCPFLSIHNLSLLIQKYELIHSCICLKISSCTHAWFWGNIHVCIRDTHPFLTSFYVEEDIYINYHEIIL